MLSGKSGFVTAGRVFLEFVFAQNPLGEAMSVTMNGGIDT
jgi:hypothetical protein